MSIRTSRLVGNLKKIADEKNHEKILVATGGLSPIVSKLHSFPGDRQSQKKGELTQQDVNLQVLQQISSRVASKSAGAESFLKLFPDLKLSMEILVSCILSPKNMMGAYLKYSMERSMMSPQLTAEVLEIVKNHLDRHYKITDRLGDIIREAMFGSGAYAFVVVPESSVDDFINQPGNNKRVSVEEFNRRLTSMATPVGLIGPTSRGKPTEGLAKEAYDLFEETTSITDNFEAVKMSKMVSKLQKASVKDIIRTGRRTEVSFESANVFKVFREASKSNPAPVKEIKQKSSTSRESIGVPLHFKGSANSLIPVFRPGDPEEHIGYFILYDETGYPIKESNMVDSLSEAQQKFSYAQVSNQGNSIVDKARRNLLGQEANIDVDSFFQLYKTIAERNLLDRVKNGLYGGEIKLAERNDIYMTMFSRAISGASTSAVFVPKEMVTYFAFDYNEDGTGKSLIEGLNIILSQRAIAMFARVMAHVKSSIDVTKVELKLDEEDIDPMKTIEMVQAKVLQLRQSYFPLGVHSVVDLVDWVTRAGLQFEYSEIPGLPNVGINFSQASVDHKVPDSDLEDDLRRFCIMSFGLSPEMVDNGFSPDFATTVVNNNILLSNRVLIHQQTMEGSLAHFINSVITNDNTLRHEIKKSIKQSKKSFVEYLTDPEKTEFDTDPEDFLESYIDELAGEIFCELPRPESTNLETTSTAFKEYKEALEAVLESIISEETLPASLAGENINENIAAIRSFYFHYLLRDWLSRENFMPEAFELINQTTDKEDKLRLNEIVKEYINSVTLSVGDLFKRLEETRAAANADVDKHLNDATGEASVGGSDSPTPDDTGGADDDFDFGGDDDFV